MPRDLVPTHTDDEGRQAYASIESVRNASGPAAAFILMMTLFDFANAPQWAGYTEWRLGSSILLFPPIWRLAARAIGIGTFLYVLAEAARRQHWIDKETDEMVKRQTLTDTTDEYDDEACWDCGARAGEEHNLACFTRDTTTADIMASFREDEAYQQAEREAKEIMQQVEREIAVDRERAKRDLEGA